MYLHVKDRLAAFLKTLKNAPFSSLWSVQTVSFSNSAKESSIFQIYGFKICWQKICGFRMKGRPIRHIFRRFQNLPVTCQRGLTEHIGNDTRKFSMLFL